MVENKKWSRIFFFFFSRPGFFFFLDRVFVNSTRFFFLDRFFFFSTGFFFSRPFFFFLDRFFFFSTVFFFSRPFFLFSTVFFILDHIFVNWTFFDASGVPYFSASQHPRLVACDLTSVLRSLRTRSRASYVRRRTLGQPRCEGLSLCLAVTDRGSWPRLLKGQLRGLLGRYK